MKTNSGVMDSGHVSGGRAGLTLCLSLVESSEVGESLVLVGAILVQSRVSCAVAEEPSPLFIGPH